MNKFLKILFGILIAISSFTWELLQDVIGLLCLVFTFLGTGKDRFKIIWYKGEIIVFGNFFSSGVSLGRFIMIDYHFGLDKYNVNNLLENTKNHEWGHSRQSLMLGPLYLFVVGIPSAIHNLYNRGLYKDITNTHERYVARQKEYYSWYCEKWADKLGGVSRIYQ